tara:strand:- start:71 stop:961 length:891 start_codon:yes stop_codon:yes gene_type:complete
MEFFDSKQEVIDIRLTQFGKRQVAKGMFKPVFYQFFDDDILYNSERAGITEEQNESESRILETPRLKTLHVNFGIEQNFKDEQKLIDSGQLPVYNIIKENDQPSAAQKLLTYSLEKNEINSQEAPRLTLSLFGPRMYNLSKTLEVDEVALPIPQLYITSSYKIERDRREILDEIPASIQDTENYLELTSDRVEFLDKSTITISREDIVIDMHEFGVDLGLDNFEVEIFEVIEQEETDKTGKKIIKEKLQQLTTKEEIKKYFDVHIDSMIEGDYGRSRDGRSSPRGRGLPIHLRGSK